MLLKKFIDSYTLWTKQSSFGSMINPFNRRRGGGFVRTQRPPGSATDVGKHSSNVCQVEACLWWPRCAGMGGVIWDNGSWLDRVMVECTLSITHCLWLNLQLHTIDLVKTCRISSFCTVAWQLARFQLTRRIARSFGDSWAYCFTVIIKLFIDR